MFPSRGPEKTVWAGAERAYSQLFQLRKQIDEALLHVDHRMAMPAFYPHFTAGRLREDYEAKLLARHIAANAAFEVPPLRVGLFALLAMQTALWHTAALRHAGRFSLAEK